MVERFSPSSDTPLAATPQAKPVAAADEPTRSNRINGRHLAFRCARLTIAGGLIVCAVLYARSTITTVRTEQAFINAEITAFLLAGQLFHSFPFAARMIVNSGQWQQTRHVESGKIVQQRKPGFLDRVVVRDNST